VKSMLHLSALQSYSAGSISIQPKLASLNLLCVLLYCYGTCFLQLPLNLVNALYDFVL